MLGDGSGPAGSGGGSVRMEVTSRLRTVLQVANEAVRNDQAGRVEAAIELYEKVSPLPNHKPARLLTCIPSPLLQTVSDMEDVLKKLPVELQEALVQHKDQYKERLAALKSVRSSQQPRTRRMSRCGHTSTYSSLHTTRGVNLPVLCRQGAVCGHHERPGQGDADSGERDPVAAGAGEQHPPALLGPAPHPHDHQLRRLHHPALPCPQAGLGAVWGQVSPLILRPFLPRSLSEMWRGVIVQVHGAVDQVAGAGERAVPAHR
jgi:hypothetical protein